MVTNNKINRFKMVTYGSNRFENKNSPTRMAIPT